MECEKLDNRILALGRSQAKAYWSFLFFDSEAVDQEIKLAGFQFPPGVDLKKFNLALNRGLYALARDLGFRKRHMNEGTNEKGQWWERKVIGIEECELKYSIRSGRV
jgi:hypothetical protein